MAPITEAEPTPIATISCDTPGCKSVIHMFVGSREQWITTARHSDWTIVGDSTFCRACSLAPFKMVSYDLVKELKDGEHVVVSRKADKGMVINIDEDTVKALYAVLLCVGGSPKTTPRGLTLALLGAMVDTIPQSEWEIPWSVYIDNNLHGSVSWA